MTHKSFNRIQRDSQVDPDRCVLCKCADVVDAFVLGVAVATSAERKPPFCAEHDRQVRERAK